ncbi:MAG: hypothetical protein ACYDEC_16105 [Bacteroidia bacterium]
MRKKKEVNSPAAAPKERVIPHRSRRRYVFAMKNSYNSGVDWELDTIRIDTKGEPAVIDFGELKKVKKPNTWRRIGTRKIPYAGLIIGHITLYTSEDLQEIKTNPELLQILVDSLDWDEFPILTDEGTISDTESLDRGGCSIQNFKL